MIDVFTQAHGRFRLLAKGARRQKTGKRALLQSFQPLFISWSGKRGLPVLTGVESRQLYPRLVRQPLASAYYLSELLFKFLHANDAHEGLFDAYDQALKELVDTHSIEAVLRSFECALLSEVGYGLQLTHDANTHKPVDPNLKYFYYPEKGPVQTDNHSDQTATVSGKTLIALANAKLNNQLVLKESKRLLRMLLTRQIKGKAFRTRDVYAQMLTVSQTNQTVTHHVK